MSRMLYVIVLVSGIVCVISGCHEDSACSKVRREIEDCGALLKRWNDADIVAATIPERIVCSVCAEQDEQVRAELSKSFADMIMSTELRLEGRDYGEFEKRVLFYKKCFESSLCLLDAAGYDGNRSVDYFFKGFDRYRNACYSISARSEDAADDARERRQVAWNLVCDYERTMRSWDKDLQFRYLKLIPRELQNEFVARAEPYLRYPTAREWMRAWVVDADEKRDCRGVGLEDRMESDLRKVSACDGVGGNVFSDVARLRNELFSLSDTSDRISRVNRLIEQLLNLPMEDGDYAAEDRRLSVVTRTVESLVGDLSSSGDDLAHVYAVRVAIVDWYRQQLRDLDVARRSFEKKPVRHEKVRQWRNCYERTFTSYRSFLNRIEWWWFPSEADRVSPDVRAALKRTVEECLGHEIRPREKMESEWNWVTEEYEKIQREGEDESAADGRVYLNGRSVE